VRVVDQLAKEKVMAPAVLGGFEHQVLLAVLRLGEEAYSAPIVLELEERTGQSMSASKVYVALRRLEKRGYLESRFEPPPGSGGGRDRRVFSLQAPAIQILKESKRNLESLWEGLPVLDEA
jgi:DNA-binding PadR family transcriptional regulator